jgi:hypothetical protein
MFDIQPRCEQFSKIFEFISAKLTNAFPAFHLSTRSSSPVGRVAETPGLGLDPKV